MVACLGVVIRVINFVCFRCAVILARQTNCVVVGRAAAATSVRICALVRHVILRRLLSPIHCEVGND